MPKIAFFGLGPMGAPMAGRLIDAGHDVVVWNRTKASAEQLRHVAAAVASSPREAAAGADFVITMLPDAEALEDALFGFNGAASVLAPGRVWIDMSTVGLDEFGSAAQRLPWGVAAVDAPVRGGVEEATDGSLVIFVGCHESLFGPMRELLEPLGHPRHVGPPGAGAAMKLVNNLTLGAAMVALGEALALGMTLGLNQDSVIDFLADSPIGRIVDEKGVNIETKQYSPNLKLAVAAKDLALVHKAARDRRIVLPETEAVRWWMERALGDGAGELDLSAVATTIIRQTASPLEAPDRATTPISFSFCPRSRVWPSGDPVESTGVYGARPKLIADGIAFQD